jgi:tetratricopeptide (TPR) repeat protein
MSSETTPLMTKEEFTKIIQEEKSKANELTKKAQYLEAIESYKEIIKKIKKEFKQNNNLTQEDKDSIIKQFVLTSYSNLSYIFIKQDDWNSAAKSANSILRYDKNNTKAIYRKCYAEIKLGEYEKAEETMEDLRKLLPPDNEELKTLENMLDETKTGDSLKQMRKYQKMMKSYYKMNEEKEYQSMSRIGKFFYDCNGICKRIFCCCNKRKTIKKIN